MIVPELNASSYQSINIWCFNELVAEERQRPFRMVVDIDDYDIGPATGSRTRVTAEDG